jgi:two-component system sensor histidine kinase/response regulator
MSETPKILIVDDIKANLTALDRALKKCDATIIEANSGEEALSQLLRHDFVLIILDVQMPIMDGFETAELIREHSETQQIPIIFVTAFSADSDDVKRGYQFGAIDFMFKPIDNVILVNKVNVLLRLHMQSKELLLNQKVAEEKEREQAINLVLKEQNAKLEKSNQALQNFAFIASHDLQEPLRSVTSYLNLLIKRKGDQLDEKAKTYVDFAFKGATQMSLLIDGLLSFSRTEQFSEVNHEVNLNEVVDSLVQEFSSKIKKTEAKIIYEKLPVVIGNRTLIKQLLQNVISNSIKFAVEGIAPRIEIIAQTNKVETKLEVKDNGIGIEEEYHSTIFEIFNKLHNQKIYKGTGIGLAICKKIVEFHNGEIWVESEEGKGTSTFFTISKSI